MGEVDIVVAVLDPTQNLVAFRLDDAWTERNAIALNCGSGFKMILLIVNCRNMALVAKDQQHLLGRGAFIGGPSDRLRIVCRGPRLLQGQRVVLLRVAARRFEQLPMNPAKHIVHEVVVGSDHEQERLADPGRQTIDRIARKTAPRLPHARHAVVEADDCIHIFVERRRSLRGH